MNAVASYGVRKSSWLLALIFALPLGAVALGLGLAVFFLPDKQRSVGIVVVACAIAIGALTVWMVTLGLRSRHCSVTLTADRIDVTTYSVVGGKATRRLASAQIPWTEVQCLITEGFDLVNATGLRWPFRNLYLFSARGDFAFYGVAWKEWDALRAEIVERSGRQPDVAAMERAGDLDVLGRQIRRNYRVMQVTSWISVAMIALMSLAALLASFS